MSQEAKIDPAIIKKTQDTLGRIIQAPSLTEKLLNRPPVQFIQDIVKSVNINKIHHFIFIFNFIFFDSYKVIKTTSFMKGLYSSEELDGGYLKTSKENKILFLNKLVIMVG
jgi:TRAF3-interacting protein 1